MKVYVYAQNGNKLMPTYPAKARVLLKSGKARVKTRVPFCIQLTYNSTEYTQPVTVGIDDGGVNVGISAVSNGKTLYQEEIALRKDVSAKLKTRRDYRRGRRYRKTRCRKARFNNRKASIAVCKVCEGNAPAGTVICRECLKAVNGKHQAYRHIQKTRFRIAPSIKAKKDMIVKAVSRIPLPVSDIILEDAFFDFHAMQNPDVTAENYQFGPLYYHRNYKKACLARDGYKCRVCASENDLRVHHIIHKKDGGSDKLSNLMTLCEACHDKHHKEGLVLPKQKNVRFGSASHVQQGKNYLYAELSKKYQVKRTFGYITSRLRNKAGVDKSHVNDAVVMAYGVPLPVSVKTTALASRKRSLHEANPRKGRKIPNRTAKRNNKNVISLKGFYRHDSVKVFGQVGYLTGFAGTSACRVVDVNGDYIKKPGKSYNNVNLSKVKRLHRNQGVVRFYIAV